MATLWFWYIGPVNIADGPGRLSVSSSRKDEVGFLSGQAESIDVPTIVHIDGRECKIDPGWIVALSAELLTTLDKLIRRSFFSPEVQHPWSESLQTHDANVMNAASTNKLNLGKEDSECDADWVDEDNWV